MGWSWAGVGNGGAGSARASLEATWDPEDTIPDGREGKMDNLAWG